MTTTALVRVTVAAPQRRMDLALPERSPVAELLPGLLRHAGESLADDGVADGGWLLRRADGRAVDAARTLGGQAVADGEVLHLVPRRLDWPELEYDDLVDAIAGGARRASREWGPAQTRAAGLAVAAVAVPLALTALARVGPPWSLPALLALAVTGVLLAAATSVARVVGDAGAGAVLAALALPCAATGGALAFGGTLPLSAFGAPHLLGGCALLLVTAVLGHLAVADRLAVFAGAATTGLAGGAAGWAVTAGLTDGTGVAAVLAGILLLFSPLFGPLAVRLGRVPLPVLPRTAADLVRDDPQPPRRAVYAAVLRADGWLTGLLSGGAITAAGCQVLLAREAGWPAVLLLGVLGSGFCVRARLYPAVRHRVPVLAAGLTGAGCLAAGPLTADPGQAVALAVPLLTVVAVLGVLLGLIYSGRQAGPMLGRYAEVAEVLLVLACVPAVCAVLGLFGLVRGWGG